MSVSKELGVTYAIWAIKYKNISRKINDVLTLRKMGDKLEKQAAKSQLKSEQNELSVFVGPRLPTRLTPVFNVDLL